MEGQREGEQGVRNHKHLGITEAKQEVEKEDKETSRDQILVDLYCHVSKYGFFLWSVGAELVRFLLKKRQGYRELV